MSNEIQNKNINLKQWADGNEPPFNPEMEVEITHIHTEATSPYLDLSTQLIPG